MIKLSKKDFQDLNRHSSKGNQLKFEKDGYWYKADFTGYEGLAEHMVSELLKHSNLSPDEFVSYDTEEIRYEDSVFYGCKSKNFLEPGMQLITLERLYKNKTGESLQKNIWKIREDNPRRLRYLVESIESITGISDFGVYIAKMMTIDAVFLNEDRHMHNIAVLMSDSGEYSVCPYFDQGASLMSDTTTDYPMNAGLDKLYPKAKAKTFNSDFDEQLDTAEKLYGDTMHFSITKKEVDSILEKEKYYPPEIINRVRDILFHQMDKYAYLF